MKRVHSIINMIKNENGFMMVELMIAAVVIGFLVATFLASTNDMKQRVVNLEANLNQTHAKLYGELQEQLQEELDFWKNAN